MRKRNLSSVSPTLSHHRIQSTEYRHMDLMTAQAVLPMVRTITRQSAADLEPIQKVLNAMVPADPRNKEARKNYRAVVDVWAGKIERLGFKVHGLWQVGFDGGSGWYVWQHPERSIRYFLEYDGLFADRELLQFKRSDNDQIVKK
jgi:hypothetical protein